MRRKGYGQGKGRGYRNLMPKDPKVHADSAKGKKQPQKEPKFIPYKGKKQSKYSDAEQEIIDELGEDTLEALRKFKSSKIEEFGEYYGDSDTYLIKYEDGEEYRIFEDEEQAERIARDQVYDDLENEPSMFSQDWLRNYYTMSDTDRRIIAGEEADSRLDGMSDDDILQEYGDGYEVINNEDAITELENEQSELDLDTRKGVERDAEIQDKLDELEEDKEGLIEDAKETAREQIYDEVYDALADPYDYFVREQGMYSDEDFYKANFVSLDVEEATEDAIAQDGWAHFISRYDGDYTELEDGRIIVREN